MILFYGGERTSSLFWAVGTSACSKPFFCLDARNTHGVYKSVCEITNEGYHKSVCKHGHFNAR